MVHPVAKHVALHMALVSNLFEPFFTRPVECQSMTRPEYTEGSYGIVQTQAEFRD